MKHKKPTIEDVLEAYDMSLPELSAELNIPKTTLQNMKGGKSSAVGDCLMVILLEVLELRKQKQVIEDFRQLLKDDA